MSNADQLFFLKFYLSRLTFVKHVALTTFEIFWIQFNVLRFAKEISLASTSRKLRRHSFEIFETQLFLFFSKIECAIKLNTTTLIVEASLVKSKNRSNLICCCCSRLNIFANFINYWSHLMRKHFDFDTSQRLIEIRKIVNIWRIYWNNYNDDDKSDNSILKKIKNILATNFIWDTILSWNLR